MKIIIAGGRDFNDYEQLCDICNDILPEFEDVSIVSGTARGADRLGERYAREHGYKVKCFPADWNRHGKQAGYMRNLEMAKYADGLIAFHDHYSRGTANMIGFASEYKLMTVVAYYLPT